MDKDQKNKIAEISLFESIKIILHKYFIVLIPIVWLIIFYIGYLFLLAPKMQEIDTQVEANEIFQKKQYNDFEKYYNELRSYKGELDRISQESVVKIGKMIPNNHNYEDLVNEIEKNILSIREGIVLKSIEVTPVEEEKAGSRRVITEDQKNNQNNDEELMKGVGTVKILIVLEETSYQSFKKLLYSLENNLRLLDVTQISTTMKEDSDITLTILAYYLK